MIYNDLSIILPEIFLSLYIMVALIGAVYTSKDELLKKLLGQQPLFLYCLLVG